MRHAEKMGPVQGLFSVWLLMLRQLACGVWEFEGKEQPNKTPNPKTLNPKPSTLIEHPNRTAPMSGSLP